MMKHATYEELRTVPLRLLRARHKFCRKMELILSEAMSKREHELDARGVNWRVSIPGKPSEDPEHDRLYSRWLKYHCEYETQRAQISSLQHEIYTATNGLITGHQYDGSVAGFMMTNPIRR